MGFYTQRIARRVADMYPSLQSDLRTAHIDMHPSQYVEKSLKASLPLAFLFTVLAFFVVDKADLPYLLLPLAFVVVFFLFFQFTLLQLKGKIIKRAKEIDREALFAGQYLLIKLYSGKPLLNALIDTTKSYGVASRYIQEIVDDIDTGSTLEHALAKAMDYSPSEKFKKILFQVNNALKLGIDVTGPLKTVLDEIKNEQENELKRYGKVLNSLVVFYMLIAVVVPSIGLTIFIVISSFIQLEIGVSHFILAAAAIVIMELFFVSMFKNMRPTLNL